MALVVLDASVVVALYVEEPASAPAREALIEATAANARLHAPDLLLIESANALSKRVSRAELGRDDAMAAINDLANLESLNLHPMDGRIVSHALALALSHRLTSYDAAYAALALALGGVLVSGDRALISGARAAGLVAVEPGDLSTHL